MQASPAIAERVRVTVEVVIASRDSARNGEAVRSRPRDGEYIRRQQDECAERGGA